MLQWDIMECLAAQLAPQLSCSISVCLQHCAVSAADPPIAGGCRSRALRCQRCGWCLMLSRSGGGEPSSTSRPRLLAKVGWLHRCLAKVISSPCVGSVCNALPICAVLWFCQVLHQLHTRSCERFGHGSLAQVYSFACHVCKVISTGAVLWSCQGLHQLHLGCCEHCGGGLHRLHPGRCEHCGGGLLALVRFTLVGSCSASPRCAIAGRQLQVLNGSETVDP